MRVVYLDEAGISDTEPFCVVAAVVVDSDRSLKGLEEALRELADSYALENRRRDFVFHAKELHHGGKERDLQSQMRGREYLKSLVHIPADNGMEVVFHYIEKAAMRAEFRPAKASERATLYHQMAFIGCAVGVEMLMRTRYPKEIAHLVAEDNAEARRFLRSAHNFLKNREEVAGLPHHIRGVLPLQHIVDTVFFAEKNESSALQLADACAFAIRRHLEQRPDASDYYDILIPALVTRPRTDAGLAEWERGQSEP